MDRNTAVSIIVPLYNRKETIARCLDSLINQTLKDIEIIVVDDGSSDDGAEVVRAYQRQDERIVLITQENQGPGAARNAGIRACRGAYVGFVDCDDYVEAGMYETMLKAAQEKKAEVAVCQEKNVCFESDGTVHVLAETKFPGNTTAVYDRQQVLDWFLNYTYLSLNSACFKLVKKTVFTEGEVWFPEQHRHIEDLVASGGIFSSVQNVAFVPESLYCYIHESGTRSTSCSLKKAADIYQDMLDVMHYLKKAGYGDRIDNFILGMKFSSLRQYYGSEENERKSREGRRFLAKWKKAGKRVRPVFRGKEIPFFHKIKVLVAYLNLERIICGIIKLLSHIPFFRYMV